MLSSLNLCPMALSSRFVTVQVPPHRSASGLRLLRPDAVKFINLTSAEPGLFPGERSTSLGTSTSLVLVDDDGPFDSCGQKPFCLVLPEVNFRRRGFESGLTGSSSEEGGSSSEEAGSTSFGSSSGSLPEAASVGLTVRTRLPLRSSVL